MSTVLRAYPELFSKPYMLGKEDMNNPGGVFNRFFDSYDLIRVREYLLYLFDCALHNSDHHLKGITFDDVLYFIQELEMLIEAAWLMRVER